MKTIVWLAIALAAGSLAAQAQQVEPATSTNPVSWTGQNEPAITPNAVWRADHPLYVLPSSSINEIKRGRFVYSGLAVDIIKQQNPLQVLNPYAPCNNTSTANLARDLSGKPVGWILFSIKF